MYDYIDICHRCEYGVIQKCGAASCAKRQNPCACVYYKRASKPKKPKCSAKYIGFIDNRW